MYGITKKSQPISVDRIDSSKSYIKGNVQLVDKRINMMKGLLTDEEFIYLCTCVANNNKDKISSMQNFNNIFLGVNENGKIFGFASKPNRYLYIPKNLIDEYKKN